MINLLPPEIKESRRYAHRNLGLMRTSAFLAFAVMLLGALLGYGYLSLSRTADEVTKASNLKQAELGEMDKLQKEAQVLADTINTAGTLLNRENKFSELIQKIGAVMPEGASLKAIRLTGDVNQPLEIAANLKSTEQAPVLQKNLVTSELFAAADILTVTRNPQVGPDGTETGERPEATLIVSFKKVDPKAKPAAKLPENFKP